MGRGWRTDWRKASHIFLRRGGHKNCLHPPASCQAPCVVHHTPKKKGKGGIVYGVISSRRVAVDVEVAVLGRAQGMFFFFYKPPRLPCGCTHSTAWKRSGTTTSRAQWELFMETAHQPPSVVDAVTSATQDPL